MISKALFREQIKVQFYLYTILLFLYQIYDGLYGLYHIDPKIIHHGMITDYEGTFADFKCSVINSTMVWLLAILVLVFMQFSFLRKKENLSFLGSLPITRQKIITTTYLSGLTILAGGCILHAFAVLAHNQTKLNGLLFGAMIRTSIAFWCIYTVLFALQAFILQNKWWVILTALTTFAVGTGAVVSAIVYECLPNKIHLETAMSLMQNVLMKCKAYAFNYLLPKNTVNIYLPSDSTFLFTGMTILLFVVGCLCAFFAMKCYCKADDADILSVFAIHIPRPVCILYGVFVGYGTSAVVIYGMIVLMSVLRRITFYRIDLLSGERADMVMRGIAIGVAFIMAVAGGLVANLILGRRKKKEGSYA